MSLKPPKKSDLNKSWMKPKPDRGLKLQPEYHLIVSEGTDTEPAYFETIRDIINGQYREKIQLSVFGEGDNTISLFQKAKQRAADSANGCRHVWVVYDTDDFPAEHIDRVVELCRENSTEETEYHAVWSNQCVELWYLLHFSYMQSDIHRAEYWPKLTGWLTGIGAGVYEKNRKDMYQTLRPFMDFAIANAKRLDAANQGKLPSKAAPGTKIYELVEKLKPYLKGGLTMATAYSPNEEFHLKIKPGDIGRYVIMPGDPGRCEKIAKYFDDAKLVSANREYTIYTGTLEGVPVSVCSTGIGGPSTAIAVEECVHCGADTFIRVGTSGGMQPEVLGGDIVVATGAIRLDGTSKEYAPIEYPAVADFDVVAALRSAAKKKGCRVHTGVVQCKDNFYGQHDPDTMPVGYELKAKWDAWLKCGALTSEMESSTLFIVGSVRRVRTGAVLAVLGNQTRRELGLEDIQVHDTETAIQVAVEAVRELIKGDRD